MNYNATDNRIVLNGYFIEQDQQGNIHIYIKDTMEYIDCIDNIGVMPYDIFISKCKELISKY